MSLWSDKREQKRKQKREKEDQEAFRDFQQWQKSNKAIMSDSIAAAEEPRSGHAFGLALDDPLHKYVNDRLEALKVGIERTYDLYVGDKYDSYENIYTLGSTTPTTILRTTPRKPGVYVTTPPQQNVITQSMPAITYTGGRTAASIAGSYTSNQLKMKQEELPSTHALDDLAEDAPLEEKFLAVMKGLSLYPGSKKIMEDVYAELLLRKEASELCTCPECGDVMQEQFTCPECQ